MVKRYPLFVITMANAKSSRKQDFRIALAIAGQTASQWAEKRGITQPYLSMILSGVRSNAVIERKIDRFIRSKLNSAVQAA